MDTVWMEPENVATRETLAIDVRTGQASFQSFNSFLVVMRQHFLFLL